MSADPLFIPTFTSIYWVTTMCEHYAGYWRYNQHWVQYNLYSLGPCNQVDQTNGEERKVNMYTSIQCDYGDLRFPNWAYWEGDWEES